MAGVDFSATFALSPWLTALLVHSTLWLGAGIASGIIWKHHAARAHSVLLLTTLAALLSPCLVLLVTHMSWGLLPSPKPAESPFNSTTPRGTQTPQPIALLREVQTGAGLAEVSSSLPSREPAELTVAPRILFGRWPIQSLLKVTWFAISCVLLVRLAVSWANCRRIVRNSSEDVRDSHCEAIAKAVARLEIRTVPILKVSPEISSPMIWCWSRSPVLLVPPSRCLDRLGRAGWVSVYCHELAHWVRRDHWASLWGELLVALLPWHPLSWLARSRLTTLQELACDGWVVHSTGDDVTYAESLLQLVSANKQQFALAAVYSKSSLRRRVRHILSGRRNSPRVGWGWSICVCTATVVSVAAVSLAQRPSSPDTSPENPEKALDKESASTRQPDEADAAAVRRARDVFLRLGVSEYLEARE